MIILIAIYLLIHLFCSWIIYYAFFGTDLPFTNDHAFKPSLTGVILALLGPFTLLVGYVMFQHPFED